MDHLDEGKKESLAKNCQEGEIVDRVLSPKAKTWMIANAPQEQTTENSSAYGENDIIEVEFDFDAEA